MRKSQLFSVICLAGSTLMASLVYAEKQPVEVITDPDKLREITDNYRSDSSRPNDFVPQGDGTVVDKHTGLQWRRCSLGQAWTGKTCEGEPKGYEWQEAVDLKETFAGHSDWRLPTRFELETLVYCSGGGGRGNERDNWDSSFPYDLNGCDEPYQHPTIVQKAFPNTGGSNEHPWYWSSSPNAGAISGAWSIDFYNGSDNYYYMLTRRYVRLVRGGQ